MKRVIIALFVLLLMIEYIPAGMSHAPLGERGDGPFTRINPTTDLIYMGAFRVPRGNYNETTFSYAGQGMCYYPYGNPNHGDDELPGSLFTVGRRSNDIYMAAEISIPKPVISANKSLDELPEARFLQNFTDITGGMQAGGLTEGKQMMDLEFFSKNETGHYDDFIYWPLYRYYLPSYDMLVFGRSRSANFSYAANHSEGLWRIENASASSVHKYMFKIPDEFANTYLNGSKLAVGRYRIVNGGSWGPALYAFAPWKYENESGVIENGTVMKGYRLIFYEGYDAPYHLNTSRILVNFSHSDDWEDGAWITVGNKSAIVIAGTKAMRRARVLNGSEYYGEPGPYAAAWGSSSKGYHGEPYLDELLFYDPNDVIRVINGEIEPYEVQPYAVFQFEKYLFRPGGTMGLGGVAYDPVRNYLYVMERGVGQPGSVYDRSPIVHVFRVVDANAQPDTTSPTTPRNLRVENVTDSSITISWDPSRDDMGDVIYVVYRLNSTPNENASWLWGINWSSNEMNDPICNLTFPVPIGITTEPRFVDVMAYAFKPPHRYLVRAFDSVMNSSGFSEVLELNDSPVIEFLPPTPPNGSVLDGDYIVVNLSVYDVNLDFSNMTVELYMGDELVESIYSESPNLYHNFTNLAPDVYTIKVIARDSAGHVSVETRRVYLGVPVPEIPVSSHLMLVAIILALLVLHRKSRDG